MVALLVRDSAPVRQNSRRKNPEDLGEGYAEYISHLAEFVMKLAEKEPERTDVWPALLLECDSLSGPVWLATHAEKTVRVFNACAKGANEGSSRASPYVSG